MFLDKLFNKKNKTKIVASEENNFNMEVVGEDVPFLYLDESKKYINAKFSRLLREENGKKYWESVKPYEIIDGNLCVRSKSDIPSMTGWIVLNKTELMDILEKLK